MDKWMDKLSADTICTLLLFLAKADLQRKGVSRESGTAYACVCVCVCVCLRALQLEWKSMQRI